jgi:hypothetical protein
MKNNTKSWLALGVVAVAGIGGLTACNSTSTVDFLKSMTLSVSQINGDEYMNLTSTFDLGNVSLAEATIGIKNPNTGAEAGQISFSQLANGEAQITLSADTNLISQSSAALGATLPNGNPIPAVLGVPAGDMLGIQIATHSVLYMGGSTATTAYVGVALGIDGFDSVMNNLSTSINLFFVGTWNNVVGVGGIYGSNTVADESGIAIFGKYTAPVAASASARSLVETKVATPAVNDYSIEKLNNYNANKLMKFFYGKKRKLSVY